MSSKPENKKEMDEFGKVLFPLDQNGDVSFNIRNLENAMKAVQQLALKCIKLSTADNELKNADEQQKDANQESTLLMGLEAAEKKGIISPFELEEVEKNAIFILRWLIELLGHKLTEDEIDEIVVEGENGDIDLDKILSILDKERVVEGKSVTELNDISEMNIQTLKRRMICLGIISRAIAKSMTEDDLIDMLLSVDQCKDQPENINYSRPKNEEPQECQASRKIEDGCKKSLFEMRNVISAFGSVLVNKAHVLSESSLKQMIEKDQIVSDSVLPRMIFRLIEKELSYGGENGGDILEKFRALDPQRNGLITIENFKTTVAKFSESYTRDGIEDYLKDAEINENGEINYLKYVDRIAQKKK